MRIVKVVVKLRGGLQMMPNGEYRARRVLTEEEAALLGKGTLTRDLGTTNRDEAADGNPNKIPADLTRKGFGTLLFLPHRGHPP
jgi:hypothetical protein